MRHHLSGRQLSRNSPHRHAHVAQHERFAAAARDDPYHAAEGQGAAPRGRAAHHARARRTARRNRRLAFSRLRDAEVVEKLFADLGPRFKARPGGYTRILRMMPRPGDSAPMALMQLVDGPQAAAEQPDPGAKKKAKRGKAQAEAKAEPKAKEGSGEGRARQGSRAGGAEEAHAQEEDRGGLIVPAPPATTPAAQLRSGRRGLLLARALLRLRRLASLAGAAFAAASSSPSARPSLRPALAALRLLLRRPARAARRRPRRPRAAWRHRSGVAGARRHAQDARVAALKRGPQDPRTASRRSGVAAVRRRCAGCASPSCLPSSFDHAAQLLAFGSVTDPHLMPQQRDRHVAHQHVAVRAVHDTADRPW